MPSAKITQLSPYIMAYLDYLAQNYPMTIQCTSHSAAVRFRLKLNTARRGMCQEFPEKAEGLSQIMFSIGPESSNIQVRARGSEEQMFQELSELPGILIQNQIQEYTDYLNQKEELEGEPEPGPVSTSEVLGSEPVQVEPPKEIDYMKRILNQ